MPIVIVPEITICAPRPYTTAVPTAATSPSATKKTRPYIAPFTPMSRTRLARPEKEAASASASP